jgi:hypothetical protein
MFGLDSLSSAAFADDAVDSTVGITAVIGTGAVGSVSMGERTVAITGVTGTGSVGTVGASNTQAITGVTATGSVGTVGVSVAPALTAVTSTGSVGTVAVAHGPALTAVTATGSVGSVTMGTRTVALTSVTATGSVGTVRTWEDVNTAETADWVDVLSVVYYEDSGAFSGGAMAATTIAGNIVTLSSPSLTVTWTDVASTGTTTWYAIAA